MSGPVQIFIQLYTLPSAFLLTQVPVYSSITILQSQEKTHYNLSFYLEQQNLVTELLQ